MPHYPVPKSLIRAQAQAIASRFCAPEIDREKAIKTLTDMYQLLDDWPDYTTWTDRDESVQKDVSKLIQKLITRPQERVCVGTKITVNGIDLYINCQGYATPSASVKPWCGDCGGRIKIKGEG